MTITTTTTRPSRIAYLTHVEVNALAEAAGPYGPLVQTLAYTGLRWGEAVALRVHDLDPLRKRIFVQRGATEVRGVIVYGTPKSHQAREVAVPGWLCEALVPHMAGKGADDLLFTTANASPVRSSAFRQRAWVQALKSAGIEPLTIHELRHTAAGLAIDAGANVKGVQAMLGHGDAAMTLNIYADLFEGHLDGVAEAMEEARSRALEAELRQEQRQVVSLDRSRVSGWCR